MKLSVNGQKYAIDALATAGWYLRKLPLRLT